MGLLLGYILKRFKTESSQKAIHVKAKFGPTVMYHTDSPNNFMDRTIAYNDKEQFPTAITAQHIRVGSYGSPSGVRFAFSFASPGSPTSQAKALYYLIKSTHAV